MSISVTPFMSAQSSVLPKRDVPLSNQELAEVAAATRNSYAARLHQAFPYRGQGVNILTIGFDAEHDGQVNAVVTGPKYGLAPQARVRLKMLQKDAFEVPIPKLDTPAQLDNYVASTIVSGINAVNHSLQEVLAAEQIPNVIDLSVENSRETLYDAFLNDILPTLAEDAQTGKFRDPRLLQIAALSGSSNQVPKERWVVAYVDRLLDTSAAFQQTMMQYRALVKALKQRGAVIIVPIGNSRDLLPYARSRHPDASANVLALSPDVIAVGASNPNQTPLDTRDDTVADFSGLMPHLAAPGESVIFDWGDEYIVSHGTSFSGGWLSALAALMLEANPRLSPSMLQLLLAQTCENPRNFSSLTTGFGVVNPFRAIASAARMQIGPKLSDVQGGNGR